MVIAKRMLARKKTANKAVRNFEGSEDHVTSPVKKFTQGINKENMLEKLVPVLLLASIALSFLVGVLWQKVSDLENGTVSGNNAALAQQPGVAEAQVPSAQDGKLTADQVKKVAVVTDKDHIKGNKNAKVVLIEYSDLQCPFCGQFHPTINQAIKEFGNDIAVVYRHFPLEQIHPQARPAAEASECVASLGGNDAFWKFVDVIFADQTNAIKDLSGTAVKAGVNKAKFDSCVAGNQFKAKVDEELQSGTNSGVQGTPATFVLNKKGDGWLIGGAYPYASVKATIEEALK